MKPLTVAYITSRYEPEVEWALESLDLECQRSLNKRLNGSGIRFIFVDSRRNERSAILRPPPNSIHCIPKPTVWSGKDRLTKADWWSAANARNTALCLCETEWIAFLDDRSVILPGWLDAIQDAMDEEYVVAGTYEKRKGMTVEIGRIKHGGIVIGEDGRESYRKEQNWPSPCKCPGAWLFGCNFALPLDWAIVVNGVEEYCDGSSGEDTMFGGHLLNSGYPIMFDPRMKIVEDRTPEKVHPIMIRRDKGVSPNDKSHALIQKFGGNKKASHGFDINEVRRHARLGFGWPKPWGPNVDWYDQQPLGEMEPG